MSPADAVRVIALLGAYYGRGIGEDTAGLWAKELVTHDFDDAQVAVRSLGRTRFRMPSLADLITAIIDARTERLGSRPAFDVGDREFPMASTLFPNVEKGYSDHTCAYCRTTRLPKRPEDYLDPETDEPLVAP